MRIKNFLKKIQKDHDAYSNTDKIQHFEDFINRFENLDFGMQEVLGISGISTFTINIDIGDAKTQLAELIGD